MTDATPSRVIYPAPPVVEVICQVTFAEAVPWSVATPGLLFKALDDEYPAEPTAMGGIRTTFNGGDGEIQVDQQAARYVFANREQTRRLVANNTCLSVNALPPYEEWPNVVARFERAVTAFRAVVADFTPSSVMLRYINRIVIPKIGFPVSDYFTVPILLAHQEDSVVRGFITRSQMALSTRDSELTVTFGSNEHSVEGQCAFLLDIEVAAPISATSELIETIEALHTIENIEFESSITPRCRELFK